MLTRGAAQTPAGRYFYGLLGTGPERFSGEAFSRGNAEFLRVDGRVKKVRTWMPETNAYRYTRAGRNYFDSQARSQWVVHVPIRIVGRRDGRRTGETYERVGRRPVTDVPGLSEAMQAPEDVRLARVRALVMDYLGEDLGGQSNEDWTLFEGGDWTVSELRTTPGENGPTTEALLERPLGEQPLSLGWLHWPEAILPEAWLDDGRCVVRQLAKELGKSTEEIEGELESPNANAVLDYCSRKGHPCHVLHNNRVIGRVTGHKRKAICFQIYENHCYFYGANEAKRAIAHLPLRDGPAVTPPWQLEQTNRKKSAKTFEVVFWQGVFKAGNYHCIEDEMTEVRREFLNAGRCPKVLMASATRIRALEYHCSSFDGCRGTIRVASLPAEYLQIQAWLARLPVAVPYRGQGLPAITQEALWRMLKRPRKSLTKAEREAIVAEQQGSCKECGEEAALEMDHVWAVSRSPLEHSASNFQGLCAACHARKSRGEQLACANPLLSYFSPSLHRSYVQSDKPRPFVWGKACGALGVHVDVRRCRYHALRENQEEIPIFCPLDNVVANPRELHDLTYISKSVAWCASKALRLLPYQGPTWYTKVATRHLLHYGKVTWADCLYGVNATGRVPGDLLREPLGVMEEAWQGDDLAKLSVNAMLGLWCREPVNYTCRTGEATGGVRQEFQYWNGTVVDHISSTVVRGGGSMRPLHDMVLQAEHCRLAEALLVITQLGTPPHKVLELKVDSVLFQPPAKRRKLVHETLASLTYADLPKLRDRFVPALWRRSAPLLGGSGEAVYRVTEGKATLGCDELPVISSPAPEGREWRTFGATGGCAEEEALDAVRRGDSMCCLGAPGTGKSHFIKTALALLEGAPGGCAEVCVVSPTHVTARQIGGDTLQHFILKRINSGSFTKGTLVCDEISMISAEQWCAISKLAFADVQFLLVGDFDQFHAPHSRWCGVEAHASPSSDMLWGLAHGNLLRLTVNHRSDPTLFDFTRSLLGCSLQDAVASARATFPRKPGSADVHLCLSHRRRVFINAAVNARHPPEAVYIKGGPRTKSANVPQDFWAYPGLCLMACCPKRGLLHNGARFTVLEASANGLKLGTDNAEEISLSLEEAGRDLRLTHAITYHCSQGMTLEGRVRLYDCGHPRYTLRHLYVGLSRAKAAALVEVV